MVRKSPILSTNQERAAHLVAEDRDSDERIAETLGIGRQTLVRWKKMPAFQQRIDAIRHEAAAGLVKQGIAVKQNRLDAYVDRHKRMTAVIDARAEDPEMADVPGGTTGLLVHQKKQIGAGRDAQVIDEYAVDAALLREMRATEQQIAKELGEWVDHTEQSGTIDHNVSFTINFDRADQDGGLRLLPVAEEGG